MVWVLKKAGELLGYDVVRKAKSDRLVHHLERFFTAHPIDLVLDRGREARSMFVFAKARGRDVIFWQSARTAKQARPNVALPTARAA